MNAAAPWAAGAFVGSAASGITMGRPGRRVLHVGLVVEAAGLLALAGVLRAAVAFWLPRRARESAGTSAAGQPGRHESVVAAG